MTERHLPQDEWERRKVRKEMEQELEDLGLSGEVKPATRTKMEVESTRKFTDEERGVIYECLIKNNNDVDEALVDYNKFSAELTKGGKKRLKPITKQTLKSFRMRNVEEYCQHIATDIGLSAIMEIAQDGKQEQTRSLAGQYLMNRGFGMPTQHIDQKVEHYTWADVENERKETLKQLGKSGEWHNPDKPEE